MIVEELIGRLSLQTKGIDKAKQATKAIQEFRKALQGLAGAARINFSGPANAAKGYRQLADSAKKAAQAQKQLAAGTGLARADAAAQRHLATVQRLSAAYKEAARSAGQIGRALTPRGGAGGRSWIRDEIAALRDYQRLQREIARESGRRGISRAGMERGISTRYGGRTDGLRNPAPGAVDVRGLIDKGFDSATTIPQVQAQMRMRKESEADIKKATDLANKLSGDVKQFTAAEHLQAIYQSLAVFGDMEKAMKAAPTMQRANALIEGLSDQYTRLKPFKGGTATKDFARIFDMMGVTEKPEKMEALSEVLLKATEQSAGDITPSDILMSLKYARSARYGLNADFLQNYLGGIIGDSKVKTGGASGAGNQLQMMFQQYHDLGAPAWALGNFAKYGLLKDKSKLEYGRKGGIKGKGGAEIVGKDVLRENPQKWVEQFIIPVLEKNMGKLTGDDDQDASKVLDFVGKIAANRITKDFISSAILQRGERERDANITRKMPGLAGLAELDKAPVSVLQQFTASVTDLFAALAAPAVQPAITAMKSLGDMARGISNFQRENPDSAPIVSGTVGATAAGAAAGVGIVGRRIVGKMVRGMFGGGQTPGGSAVPPTTPTGPTPTVPPTTPTTTASPVEARPATTTTTTTAAEQARVSTTARPGPAVGPQASAMDVAARGLAKAAAAAAIPVTISQTLDERRAMMLRLGKLAKEREAAKAGASGGAAPSVPGTTGTPPTTPPPPAAPAPSASPAPSPRPPATTTPSSTPAVTPNIGAVDARLNEIQASTQATADKMKDALSFTAKPAVDASGIDAAIAKAQHLKSLLDGAKSAAASAVAGIGGASLAKGSNSFTSPGATAP